MKNIKIKNVGVCALMLPLFVPYVGNAQIADNAPKNGLLNPIFQDNSVIQRGKGTRIYGVTKPNQNITASFQNKNYKAKSDKNGKWQIALDEIKDGGPYELNVQGGNENIKLSNILVGDVFLCAGQSNMQFMVSQSRNTDAELAGANNDKIRLLNLERRNSEKELDTFASETKWQDATKESVKNFSAVCYFMGREINADYKIPVGLINSSWGGSIIQDWMPQRALRNFSDYTQSLDLLNQYATNKDAGLKTLSERTEKWIAENDFGVQTPIKAYESNYDDSSWAEVEQPGLWEGTGKADLRSLDGVVYFRRKINIDENNLKSGETTLSLGSIDERDQTYINGVKIGESNDYRTERLYKIPAGVLKAGENTITIRAIDDNGGGGLRTDKSKTYLQFGNGEKQSIAGIWKYKIAGDFNRKYPRAPFIPWMGAKGYTSIYNAMIKPIAPYNLKGFVWYQGEQNTNETARYKELLPLLINSWREDFKTNATFVIVQLANYGGMSAKPTENGFAGIRNVQREVANNLTNTGLVVAIDVGNPRDVHPTEKQEVGKRAKQEFDRLSYGIKEAPKSPSSPVAVRDGDNIRISFENANGGLVTYSSNNPIGFEICTIDFKCSYADATLNDNIITIKTSNTDAKYVRYGWAGTPIVNLYTDKSLPVSPFQIEVK